MSCRSVSGCSIIIAVVLLATGLSACGFKSDLSQTDSENDSPLFVSDNELDVVPAGSIDERPPFLPSSEPVEGEEIRLPKISTEAADGDILVSPGSEGVAAEEGEPVDLTELIRSIERERNAQ